MRLPWTTRRRPTAAAARSGRLRSLVVEALEGRVLCSGGMGRVRGGPPAPAIHRRAAHPAPSPPANSINWSGFAVEPGAASPRQGGVTAVRGSWVVPAVLDDRPRQAASATWIGIDGYRNGTVEQVGIEQDANGHDFAWFEFFPRGSVMISRGSSIQAPGVAVPAVVQAGDRIDASVTVAGRSLFHIVLTDTTEGWSFAMAQAVRRAQRGSAEWVEEAPTRGAGALPLADFGVVSFAGAQVTINGRSGAIDDPAWQASKISLDQPGFTTAIATTSDLSPATLGDGTGASSFSIAWVHS